MIFNHIASLVEKAIEQELIEETDRMYTRNQILAQLKLDTWPSDICNISNDSIPHQLDKIINYAIENNIIENVFDEKEVLKANIMNCFIDLPSTVNSKFYQKYKISPKEATNYFYELSKNSNYIQMEQIKKNIHFMTSTSYGDIEITINLSKPEKDPEQIKREREMKRLQIEYPKCLLCIENEGYEGRTGYPARANHRIIKVPLLGENWYLQYSPYIYYNEHSILLCEEHRDMKINRDTFERLLLFVEKFPHYFIGSNADLPIVGGSILSHDHYQAGHHSFAMEKAETILTFGLEQFEGIEGAILKWPLSVIRIKGKNKNELVEASEAILTAWQNYSDEESGIIAFTNDIPHNTITPIARMRDSEFEMDLVLRNNRTTEAFPSGVFHPHEDVQHIKKENIGLIEVMGLAVLPARLKEELEEIKKYVLNKPCEVPAYHQKWAEQLKDNYVAHMDVTQLIQEELGYKFIRILEDAGVFKQDEKGIRAFERFIRTI
ncbi:UDP-glucose--hexose-1-phosphate uridylyltransferase [Pseudogracilibacillus sp. SE30717A]|uniref:UDP-glucose--hexose-1-phosphate uridylyltransferase n=1 Tax=Pseudogracilibacillus sp. SE30717A TaxID=3098293 RepID=UPI00300E335F